MTPSRLGIVFRPQLPPQRLRDCVQAAESAGLDDFWLWEDCFLEGGLTTATAALGMTERIRVGVGLLPVPLRNPALAAMEIATIAGLFPGRFAAGLGHGVLDWMAQVGARAASPVTLLREYVTAVRDLLHGRTVTTHGRFVHLDEVALDWPPETPPPVLVGARGPATLKVAGETADGTILDIVSSGDKVSASRVTIDEGRAAAGRTGEHHVVVYTEIPDEHVDAGFVSALVDELAKAGADTVVLQPSGTTPDPAALIDIAADLVARR